MIHAGENAAGGSILSLKRHWPVITSGGVKLALPRSWAIAEAQIPFAQPVGPGVLDVEPLSSILVITSPTHHQRHWFSETR